MSPEPAVSPQPEPSTTPAHPIAVEVVGLRKTFSGNVAVDSIDLEIRRGSFFGIVGPNGAGKTTTLRMITGLLRPDRGEVTVAGVDVWSDSELAKTRFGIVPDQPRLFDRLTGRELLDFTGRLRSMDPALVSERTGQLLRLLDLEDAADALVADYSYGMTKKVAIAAALLHDPRVLFLDEPFAGIDPVARQTLEAILRRHTERGGTVVFSDHAMDVVERLCDELVVIHHGRVLVGGPVDDLTDGRRLQDVFVDLVGARATEEGDLEWLGSSFD